MRFEKELEMLINRHSKEQESDTPDFILAVYLKRCLNNYAETVKARDRWYGFSGLSGTEPAITMHDLDPSAADCVQKHFSELIKTEPVLEESE